MPPGPLRSLTLPWNWGKGTEFKSADSTAAQSSSLYSCFFIPWWCSRGMLLLESWPLVCPPLGRTDLNLHSVGYWVAYWQEMGSDAGQVCLRDGKSRRWCRRICPSITRWEERQKHTGWEIGEEPHTHSCLPRPWRLTALSQALFCSPSLYKPESKGANKAIKVNWSPPPNQSTLGSGFLGKRVASCWQNLVGMNVFEV